MGRLSTSLARLRRPPGPDPQERPDAPAIDPAAPQETSPPPRRVPLPSPGQIRRERRVLLRQREERIRDLGGLMLEMYRRDYFRQDLVVERCNELTELDERLHEMDALLAASTAGRRLGGSRCACGAPVIWGSHFCANCGRPVGEAPVVTCPGCGGALAADARFCPACGRAVEGEGNVPEAPEPRAQTTQADGSPADEAGPPAEQVPHQEPEPAADPWER